MITVCLNEANFEYDIHSLVQAFFAGEEVKVFADGEKICRLEQERMPLLHMETAFLPQGVGAGTAGSQEGMEKGSYFSGSGQDGKDRIEIKVYLPPESLPAQPFTAGGYTLAAQASAAADFSDRKMTKDRLKQALYQMLVEYTGHSLPWGSLTGIRPVKIPMSMLGQGKGEQEIRDYMAKTYFASEQKINLSIEIAKLERELLSQIDYQDGYSLYVGIPFWLSP